MNKEKLDKILAFYNHMLNEHGIIISKNCIDFIYNIMDLDERDIKYINTQVKVINMIYRLGL